MQDLNKLRMIWMESAEVRLQEWRSFRKEISPKPLHEQIADIHQWWMFAPRSNISVDPYDEKTWGTAWELIHNGDICKFSVAVGMAYTMFYVDNSISNEIMLIKDEANNDTYMICVLDGVYVMNYDTCELTLWDNIKDTIQIQKQWTCADLAH